MIARLTLVALALFFAGCETLPEPLARPIHVDSLEVISGRFNGPFEAIAVVEGHLSNGAAFLTEPRQYRRGYRLFVELNEKTPNDATGTMALVPVERRIPINLEGLPAGIYLVSVNGVEEHLEIRDFDLRPIRDDEIFL